MFFNFKNKNKNMLIILLLLLVLASVFCYSVMMKSVEGNTNIGSTIFSDYFKIAKKDYLRDMEYYRINTNTATNEISFISETSIDDLTNVQIPASDVTYDINEYMFSNSYDLYIKFIEFDTQDNTDKEFYKFFKITDIPYTLSIGTQDGSTQQQDYSGNILIGIKNNDYTKVYSSVGHILDITVNVIDSDNNNNKTVLIQNGILKVQPQGPVSTTTPTNPFSSSSGVNIGDINLQGGLPGGLVPGGYYPIMNPYMLPGSVPILMNQYNTPFYGDYSSFESAMNNPSNPLVNPVNSMNPVEYSQTLFGPWTTPMMTKTACLNCDETKEKVNYKNGFSNNIFDNINSKANTIMDENREVDENRQVDENGEVDENEGSNVRMNRKSGNSNNNFSDYSSNNSNVNSSNNNQAPCPPCGRCPDTSNFECKKVPNYEMGLDNTSLPRPILSDFSTFGT